MNHIKLGSLGEDIAANYLSLNGYQIIERNFRSRLGEIDIIAKTSSTLVFIEVKTRRNFSFGIPSEAVTYGKQQKILHTALYYLKKMNIHQETSCRFDVIEVYKKKTGEAQCRHIENAFSQ